MLVPLFSLFGPDLKLPAARHVSHSTKSLWWYEFAPVSFVESAFD
jgi:hypothetical protein